jgi:hypothetical protein
VLEENFHMQAFATFLVSFNVYIYISFRSCDNCRRLPEPTHHSYLFNHWSASKCLVFMAARTPSIQVSLGRPLFLLSPGIHSIINVGNLSSCLLLTWPYHWSLFLSMMSIYINKYIYIYLLHCILITSVPSIEDTVCNLLHASCLMSLLHTTKSCHCVLVFTQDLRLPSWTFLKYDGWMCRFIYTKYALNWINKFFTTPFFRFSHSCNFYSIVATRMQRHSRMVTYSKLQFVICLGYPLWNFF